MTYNKNIKKYIKQCKYLFASYGKYQKTFEEIRDSKGGYFEETIEIK